MKPKQSILTALTCFLAFSLSISNRSCARNAPRTVINKSFIIDASATEKSLKKCILWKKKLSSTYYENSNYL